MKVVDWKKVKEEKIETFPYQGKTYDVRGIGIRWLSRAEDNSGQPEYGLRFFTAQPNGEIPTHNHFYQQTMYIVSGDFECWSADPETGEKIDTCVCGPGETIYLDSMEPHGMRNLSDTEEATFLCCICNVYNDQGV